MSSTSIAEPRPPAGAPGSPEAPAERAAFSGVFAAAFMAILGLGSVISVLPRYVEGPLGGGDVAVGLTVGAFAFTAVVTRPLAGRLADVRGRRVVLLSGALLSALAGGFSFLPFGVPGLLAGRLVLGVGEAFVFTAGAAWAVDLAPVHRRGRVLGLFGLAVWTAMSVGPLMGEGLRILGGYELAFAFATAVPLAGAALASRLPAGMASPEAAAAKGGWLAREAVGPGAALSLAAFGFAALSAFVILHLEARGDDGGAVVFAAFAVSVVLTRLLAGQLPDKVGARRCALVAAVADAVGLVLIASASSLPLALAGALLMGAGFSTLYPALALIVVDRVGEARRGTGLGTFTAFFDLGVGVGGVAAGGLAAVAGYPAAFWAGAAAALVGLAIIASLTPAPAGDGVVPVER